MKVGISLAVQQVRKKPTVPGAPPSNAGESVGLLLLLTKAA
jgi:hypothetical protein